ncbi:Stp1/IreP family PP2C-type Ser/Thr phosphatase [Clostridium intestinale]|uniref:Stp1/IreP family PP2C-type Ser/Thr phosphatase n=1 Tax=Clostridium intestinale TaxID=36845 RepID=A0A7D7A2Y9_9CLOT|nr:Stp1/IreP family PP2C-type Ser/Thr phosphatase [Clostridium intestinale]QLY81975.1 Stp1/IreP family PP2C-type Ser/Thr phosphatase [Clostridium intestinale]
MIGLISDVGKRRPVNEDYADYHETDEYKLFIVADGMGGHNAGEIASKLATEIILEYIKDNWDTFKEDCILENAIKASNKKVLSVSNKDEEFKGMGTTIAACLITELHIYVANVGDSACFMLEEQKLIKVTKDHSLVQELLDSGSITEEEASTHPRKNIITRAVGAYEEVMVDIFKLPKVMKNKYLLCSDGLLNEVTNDEIEDILNNYDNEEAAKQLVTLANEREGRDNITVLVFGGEL